MAQLYSISIASQPFIGTHMVAIDQKLGTLGDWIRFNPTQWFLWSDRSKADITANIEATLAGGDQVIILAVAAEFPHGKAPQWVWNWLNEKISKKVTGL